MNAKMTIGELYDQLGFQVLSGNAGAPVSIKVVPDDSLVSSSEEEKYPINSIAVENGSLFLVGVQNEQAARQVSGA